jgi:hypothetical protein
MLDFLVILSIASSAALIFGAGWIAMGSWPAGAIAAAAFTVSPLLWSDRPSAGLYPLPFVSAWLLASALLLQRRELSWAVIAGVSLGAGVYVSPAAAVMMPAYAAVMVMVMALSRQVPRAHLAAVLATFAVIAAPRFIGWLIDPAPYRAIVMEHHLYDAQRYNVLQGIREVTSWVGLTARSEVFWDYLNPAFLFVTGRVLSWPLVVLLPIGIYFVIARDVAVMSRLVLAAYVMAPLAASLPAEPPMRGRIAWILPAAALLTAFGVELIRRRWPGAERGAAR